MREKIEWIESNVRNGDVPDTVNAELVLVGLGTAGEVLADAAAVGVDQGDGEVLWIGAMALLVSWVI
jgi:hypothetical protein